MRRNKKLRCIFMLPLLLLLVYFGASLSNVLPGSGGERTIGVTPPGAPPEGAEPATEVTGYGGFDEPEWIDYPVCRMLYLSLIHI